MLKARIDIRLHQAVLDPQGQAIGQSLKNLGFEGVGEVRQGKVIELELPDMPQEEAKAQLTQMCEKLLANPVIETYDITLV